MIKILKLKILPMHLKKPLRNMLKLNHSSVPVMTNKTSMNGMRRKLRILNPPRRKSRSLMPSASLVFPQPSPAELLHHRGHRGDMCRANPLLQAYLKEGHRGDRWREYPFPPAYGRQGARVVNLNTVIVIFFTILSHRYIFFKRYQFFSQRAILEPK